MLYKISVDLQTTISGSRFTTIMDEFIFGKRKLVILSQLNFQVVDLNPVFGYKSLVTFSLGPCGALILMR